MRLDVLAGYIGNELLITVERSVKNQALHRTMLSCTKFPGIIQPAKLRPRPLMFQLAFPSSLVYSSQAVPGSPGIFGGRGDGNNAGAE